VFGATGNVGVSFALKGNLVVPPNHECDPGKGSQVGALARAGGGAEDEFAAVGGRDANERGLRSTVRAARHDGQRPLADELDELRAVHRGAPSVAPIEDRERSAAAAGDRFGVRTGRSTG
jgi:hypothetical protein